MLDILKQIHVYSVKIICSAITPITFPNFPGIALRGGFGVALKQSVCIMKQIHYCAQCSLASICVYSQIFENPNTLSNNKMKKLDYIPHPFSLAPLFHYPVTFKPGQTFEFKITLFGNSYKYFPNVMYAFIKLGDIGIGSKRGKFKIARIESYETGKIIYNGENIHLHDITPYQFDTIECTTNEINVAFITPCKLKSNGKYQRHVDIETIMRNIRRKIEIISSFFEDNPVKIDMSNIDLSSIQCIRSNVEWEVVTRYSRRRNERMPLGGYKGTATFLGNVASIYPLLKVGELINVGSNSSFGFGAIRVM